MRCATRRRARWPERSSCAARCTAGRRSATTCRSPRSRCSRRSSRCPSTSPCTRRRAASPPCSPAASRARPCCSAATWTPCRCTRTPGSTSRRTHDDQMHACGHDTHTAMLVGAARLLADRAGELAGRVLFMFQPGEEGEHGARFMLDEGLLDVPPLADGTPSPVTGAFALHITSTLPTGLADVPRRADDGVGRHAARSRSRARAGTPASRSAPSTRSRSPARSSRRCRRW